jgi:hypothetical protein
MSNNSSHSFQNTFSKWLFSGALLLSLFAFSGLAAQTQIKSDRVQTTIVVNSNVTLVKSISYKRVILHAQRKRPAVSFFTVLGSDLGRLYSQQIKTCILALSQPCKASHDSRFFYYVKTFPQSSDDAPVISLG